MALLQSLEKLERMTKKILEFVVFILFAVMTTLTFAQVFTRFFLNASLSWSEELARFTLVWLVFTASILTYGEKIHIAVDALTCKLTGMTSHVVQICNRVCVLLFCCAVIAGAVEFLPVTALQKSPACGILMSYVYSAIPLSMAFMGLTTIKEICGIIRSMGRTKEDAE
ncbi:Tripartite ATP-independent periplasmic transporter DctQ component [uncultured delta proteobacterium]|uniref:Tripartite ATP-independent periplasmic transporter DctQ component n=1 Tax=uncultured delta proteobacterium TaxID=34034 RepID=A0A212JCA7_9DELT|nr:Tripartite ATP-independent periplasmic transporter DctQ component [uncultured delta proteobacterium]